MRTNIWALPVWTFWRIHAHKASAVGAVSHLCIHQHMCSHIPARICPPGSCQLLPFWTMSRFILVCSATSSSLCTPLGGNKGGRNAKSYPGLKEAKQRGSREREKGKVKEKWEVNGRRFRVLPSLFSCLWEIVIFSTRY